jgi:hypothetical protein
LPDFLYWHYSPAMFYSDGFEEGLAVISKVHPRAISWQRQRSFLLSPPPFSFVCVRFAATHY